MPFEVISLAAALEHSRDIASRAYIVLVGTGWTLKDFYTNGSLEHYLRNTEQIRVITIDRFLELVSEHRL